MCAMQYCAQFTQVSKHFGATAALNSIELQFPAQAISAVVGASGSGKSTLLQHINGLLRPDQGEVQVLGQPLDYADLIPLRRRVGYAVQGIGLFPHLRVFDNISLLARLEGWSGERIKQRVDQLMALVRLDAAHTQRYPHMLSGGQQQRVGLCRALMLRPPLLLLDEPFSGLDPLTRGELQDEVLNLHQREQVAVILVTHDMSEAARLASRVAILRDGRLLQEGPLSELTRDPADAYVQQLLRGLT